MSGRNLAARAMTVRAMQNLAPSDRVIDGDMNVWIRMSGGDRWSSKGQPVLTSERLRRYHGPIKPWNGSAQ